MVAEEVFVSYHSFNPIWVQHASIFVKKYWYSSHKRYSICQGILQNLFGAGAEAVTGAGVGVGVGPKEIISAPQHCFQARQRENWSVPQQTDKYQCICWKTY
jgi:hypothetical protein